MMDKRQILKIATTTLLIVAAFATFLVPITEMGPYTRIVGLDLAVDESFSFFQWIKAEFTGAKIIDFYNELAYTGESVLTVTTTAVISIISIIMLPVSATFIWLLKSRYKAVTGVIFSLSTEIMLFIKAVQMNKISKVAKADSFINDFTEGEAVMSFHFGFFVVFILLLLCFASAVCLFISDLNSVPLNKKVFAEGKEEFQKKNKINFEIHGITGMYAGAVFEIKPGETICFGRDAGECQIVIIQNNAAISRKHCIVMCDMVSGEYKIIDYSSNGTYIDGKQIESGVPYVIPYGSRFWLGNEENSFSVHRS